VPVKKKKKIPCILVNIVVRNILYDLVHSFSYIFLIRTDAHAMKTYCRVRV
jgi:hypothetical protein